MKSRLVYLLSYLVATMLVFVVAKPLFMLANSAEGAFTASDVLDVVLHGLTLDVSMSLYLLAVPLLAVLISVWLRRWSPVRTFLKCWYALAALAMSLALVADASLYRFWGFKLDASVFQYIDRTGNAFASVSAGYLIVRLLLVCAVAIVIYFIYLWLTPREKQRRRSIREVGVFRSRSREGSVAPLRTLGGRIAASLFLLLMMPLVVIGIRGGLSVSTTNVGQAYFSQNQFLNHSAVNPLFSFFASIGKSTADIADYSFFTDDECQTLLRGTFFTDGTPRDTLLRTQRPDIVIIVMESCGGEFTEMGGHADVTPNLTRLSRESIYFTQCYANSWRTDRGLVSILSGWPAFPKTSVMKMPSKVRHLPGLPQTLARQGYSTTFLYGGDADFTNTRGYLLATGTQTVVSEDDFTAQQRGSSKWGVCDSITFDRLYDLVTADKEGKRPRLITHLTLSSHEPWTVPMPTRFQDEVLNAFFYLDHCLGRFIDRLRNTPQWDNTLVVILPDHGIKYGDIGETHPLRSHIPMLWTGGAIRSPHRIGTLCCQSDLAATLLGQMNIPHTDFPFSRDILSSRYQRPFAMHTHADGFAVVDSTGFHAYDLNANRVVVGKDGTAIQLGKAVLQHTANDLRNR